jgi:hypothetical protein
LSTTFDTSRNRSLDERAAWLLLEGARVSCELGSYPPCSIGSIPPPPPGYDGEALGAEPPVLLEPLEEAPVPLVQLASVEVMEEEEPPSSRGDNTPIPLVLERPETPIALTLPAAHLRPSRAPFFVGGVALAILGALGALVAQRVLETGRYKATSITVVQVGHAPAAHAAGAPPVVGAALQGADSIPTVKLDSLPVVTGTQGSLVFGPAVRGHRIFVDGAVTNETTALAVRCGQHTVRIGSQGAARIVDVPCGGQLTL